MKKIIISIFLLLLLANTGKAQSWKAAKLELFGGVSALQYFGDIGGAVGDTKLLGLMDIDIAATRPGLDLGARYQLSKPIHVRAHFTTGLLTKSDANSRNETRNFAFSTTVNELAVMGEYYLIPESDDNYYYNIMQIRGGLRHFRQPFSLYVTLGVGGFHYKVTPKELLATSPRFSQTTSLAAFFPVGIGIKYTFLPRISVGVELLGRITTTNELDGFASEFGNFNDVYNSLTFKVNYKIPTGRKPGALR